MPELPDVELYRHCLASRVVGQPVRDVTIVSPFLLRSFEPPIETIIGRRIDAIGSVGKRFVFELEGGLRLLVHLMIAGRFRWHDGATRPGRSKIVLATIGFDPGTLVITEAASRKRAAMHLVCGDDAVSAFDRGGLEILESDLDAFRVALRRENRTLKRALTDPRLFSGIGNAYSDEILHRARLAPTALSRSLDEAAVQRLFDATRTTLEEWIERLRKQFGDRFPGPGEVTAFRPEMAVHGKFGQPCPVCRTAVQRIVYAQKEVNYCPTCQTGGRLLADRSLSRLLRDDWPPLSP